MKIFDGYNVIGGGGAVGLDLGQADKEDRLILLLSKYRSRARIRAPFLVVFDGDYGRLAVGPKKFRRAGIAVEYAIGESADTLIGRRVARAVNPPELEVITSDREVLRAARQARARTVRTPDFIARLKKTLGPEGLPEKPEGPSRDEVEEWLAVFGEGEEDA